MELLFRWSERCWFCQFVMLLFVVLLRKSVSYIKITAILFYSKNYLYRHNFISTYFSVTKQSFWLKRQLCCTNSVKKTFNFTLTEWSQMVVSSAVCQQQETFSNIVCYMIRNFHLHVFKLRCKCVCVCVCVCVHRCQESQRDPMCCGTRVFSRAATKLCQSYVCLSHIPYLKNHTSKNSTLFLGFTISAFLIDFPTFVLNLSGALCSFGGDILIRRESSSNSDLLD